MKVRCIMSRGHELHITKNHVYKVKSKVSEYQYGILDDVNKFYIVHKDFFIIDSYSILDKIKMFFSKLRGNIND